MLVPGGGTRASTGHPSDAGRRSRSPASCVRARGPGLITQHVDHPVGGATPLRHRQDTAPRASSCLIVSTERQPHVAEPAVRAMAAMKPERPDVPNTRRSTLMQCPVDARARGQDGQEPDASRNRDSRHPRRSRPSRSSRRRGRPPGELQAPTSGFRWRRWDLNTRPLLAKSDVRCPPATLSVLA
jgi:hypothetical protein